MSQIPPHARWIAAALYLGGQSYPEIARQFDCTPRQAREAIRWQASKLGIVLRNVHGNRPRGAVGLRHAAELERRMRAVGLVA